jgi:hypothetical protein
MSLSSLNAVPIKVMPNGSPGAFSTRGVAGVALTLTGWKPSGTVEKFDKYDLYVNKG